jgi:trk system potassium uptake protein TrkH
VHLVILMNGMVCVLIGLLMAAPMAADPGGAAPFALAAFCAIAFGLALAIAARGAENDFRARHAFLLTASAWTTAAMVCALPMMFAGLSATDAFFESMSGLTTTGSTVLTGLDTMARGILVWRALTQWIGGIGIIVTGIAVLPFLRVGGMQLFRAESSDKADKELASAARFAAITLRVYVALTALCAIAYAMGGMGGFDAVLHAMTTVSTGGFSTYDASIGHFGSPTIEWIAVVFMLSGSLPFVWYIRILNRGAWRSEQVTAYLGSLAAIVLGLAIWLALRHGETPSDALRMSAFNVVSVVTTTGFATVDYIAWGPFPVAVFFIITFFGGCTGSTSGGLKAMRLVIAVKAVRAAIRRIHNPHAVVVIRYEGRLVSDDVMGGMTAFLTFYTLTFAVLTLSLSMMGLDFQTAVSGAITALSNVGPGVGPIIGPAGNFSTLPDDAKWLLSLGMLLGRLEVMTVLALFTMGSLRP